MTKTGCFKAEKDINNMYYPVGKCAVCGKPIYGEKPWDAASIPPAHVVCTCYTPMAKQVIKHASVKAITDLNVVEVAPPN